jgi:hypothetical protein
MNIDQTKPSAKRLRSRKKSIKNRSEDYAKMAKAVIK